VATSVISGFVIFSALGFMAVNNGKRVEDVAKAGENLSVCFQVLTLTNKFSAIENTPKEPQIYLFICFRSKTS
jgi:SNF family Na+-dependent transporter